MNVSSYADGDGLLQPGWYHFHHQADIGVRGVATSLAQAFEAVAVALTAVITNPLQVECRELVTIECHAPDYELLLCDWLNALIYEMALRKMLFARFAVTLSDTTLRAEVWGESVDIAKHQPAVEVKGATYTELKVCQTSGMWLAQCVVDV